MSGLLGKVGYTNHSRRHLPGGSDPLSGPWIYVGEAGAPAFENGWENVVFDDLVPMRFRHAHLGTDPTLVSVEIQGSVKDGADGTTVFTLPEGYRPDYELRLAASDDVGDFVVFRVLPSGEVVHGV